MNFGIDLADGFGNIVIHAGIGGGDEALGADDASDGGGGETEDAKDIGMLVEASIGIEGFDQAASEDANEGDLFDETGDIGGFDAGEVTLFEAAGVEAVFEIVEVAKGGAAAAGGGCGHRDALEGWQVRRLNV